MLTAMIMMRMWLRKLVQGLLRLMVRVAGMMRLNLRVLTRLLMGLAVQRNLG